jgi:hypothetical protein
VLEHVLVDIRLISPLLINRVKVVNPTVINCDVATTALGSSQINPRVVYERSLLNCEPRGCKKHAITAEIKGEICWWFFF